MSIFGRPAVPPGREVGRSHEVESHRFQFLTELPTPATSAAFRNTSLKVPSQVAASPMAATARAHRCELPGQLLSSTLQLLPKEPDTDHKRPSLAQSLITISMTPRQTPTTPASGQLVPFPTKPPHHVGTSDIRPSLLLGSELRSFAHTFQDVKVPAITAGTKGAKHIESGKLLEPAWAVGKSRALAAMDGADGPPVDDLIGEAPSEEDTEPKKKATRRKSVQATAMAPSSSLEASTVHEMESRMALSKISTKGKNGQIQNVQIPLSSCLVASTENLKEEKMTKIKETVMLLLKPSAGEAFDESAKIARNWANLSTSTEPKEQQHKNLPDGAASEAAERQVMSLDECSKELRKALNQRCVTLLEGFAWGNLAGPFTGPDPTLPPRSYYNHIHSLDEIREIMVNPELVRDDDNGGIDTLAPASGSRVVTKDQRKSATIAAVGQKRAQAVLDEERVNANAPSWLRWEKGLHDIVQPSDETLATGASSLFAQTLAAQSPRGVSYAKLSNAVSASSLPLIQVPNSRQKEKPINRKLMERERPWHIAKVPKPKKTDIDEKELVSVPRPARRVSVELDECGLLDHRIIDERREREALEDQRRFNHGQPSPQALEGLMVVDEVQQHSDAQKKIARIRKQAAATQRIVEIQANEIIQSRDEAGLGRGDIVEEMAFEQITEEAERGGAPRPQETDIHTREFEKGLVARRLLRNRQQVEDQDHHSKDWALWRHASNKSLAIGREQIRTPTIAHRMHLQWIESGKKFVDGEAIPCYTAKKLLRAYDDGSPK